MSEENDKPFTEDEFLEALKKASQPTDQAEDLEEDEQAEQE